MVYTRRMADPNLKEDLPFRHYTLKHRLIAWISMHLFDTATYRVRHGLHEAEGRARLASGDVLARHYDGRTAILVWSQSQRYDCLRHRRLPRFVDSVLRFAG